MDLCKKCGGGAVKTEKGALKCLSCNKLVQFCRCSPGGEGGVISGNPPAPKDKLRLPGDVNPFRPGLDSSPGNTDPIIKPPVLSSPAPREIVKPLVSSSEFKALEKKPDPAGLACPPVGALSVDPAALRAVLDGKAAQASAFRQALYEYEFSMMSNRRGVWKGYVRGSNVIDISGRLEEIYTKGEEDGAGGYSVAYGKRGQVKFTINKDELDRIKKAVDSWGSSLYVVLYEREKPGFSMPLIYSKFSEHILIAYADQLDGWASDDGILSLRAPGTTSWGRFEYPSGYPDRGKFIVSELRALAWVEINRMLVSDLGNIVKDSLSINPSLAQLIGVKRSEQPSKIIKSESV